MKVLLRKFCLFNRIHLDMNVRQQHGDVASAAVFFEKRILHEEGNRSERAYY